MPDPADTNAILAIAAGLQRAWADHRADVEQAIAVAARLRAGFARPDSPAAEPTPAYRAPASRAPASHAPGSRAPGTPT